MKTYKLEGEKCAKTFFKVLEGQNMKNQTKFELYTDHNKYILKSTKKIMRNSITVATTEFVCKIPNRKKISNEQFNLCEA